MVGINVFFLRVIGDTETGRDLKYDAADFNRFCSGGKQTFKQRYTGINFNQIDQQGDKLVAAQTGDGVDFAQGLLHAHCHGDQQLVANIMPVQVVDGFEAIKVEKDHHHPLFVPLRLSHDLLHAIGQQDAVG